MAMRPSLRRYLLAQRISAATPTATMSKMVNSGHPKPNGIRSTPCFLWDGRFLQQSASCPMCPQGAQAPSITRRTDTNTNSVAWANPSALLQRLAYPTPGDCQAQTRRRAPTAPPPTRQPPLARTPPPCATMDPDRPSRSARRGRKEDEAGERGALHSAPFPLQTAPFPPQIAPNGALKRTRR